MTDAETIEIIGIGSAGDGDGANGRFVPFALPGETWRATTEGGFERTGAASPIRVTPPCRHFGVCGGCLMQHVQHEAYAAWKRDLIVNAFHHHGLDLTMAPLVETPVGSRRRVVMTAQRTRSGLVLGFHVRGSHGLVDLAMCPVSVPEIVASLSDLRALLAGLLAPNQEVHLTVLATRLGLDVAIDAERALTPAQRQTIAAASSFLRVSWRGEPVVTRGPVTLDVDNIAMTVPPRGFVQAVAAAEQTLRAAVIEGIGRARHVADLFCGAGTFTLALARSARVSAYDGDQALIDALNTSARHAHGLKPIVTTRRDLFREPLSARELGAFEAVVLDPPRAGAKAQVETLAKSTVPAIIYVSCNPATLARDARMLTDNGYRIDAVTPVDQFLWSDHVEVIVRFSRTRRRG